MKFLVYTNRSEFIYKDIFERFPQRHTVEIISEMPNTTSIDEILIIDYAGPVSNEFINNLKFKNLKYIAIIENYAFENVPFLVRFGGGISIRSNLGEEELISSLATAVEDIKARDISHHFTHNEMELFRTVARFINIEKELIIKILYGATNESTLDVNLNRLRKKLKDPEVGDDFFRVISKDKKLHLTSRFRDYKSFPQV